jgi:hypothetical protein
MESYFCARFIALAAAFRSFFFGLLLRSSCDNLIYGREVINHDKEPLPVTEPQKGDYI